MGHDHLCESRRLIAPTSSGICNCANRAYHANPIPEDLVPIYPPYENPNAKPVQTSTTWQAKTWADRQITPEELSPNAPATDSVCSPTTTGEQG